jgi:hypothetical protein
MQANLEHPFLEVPQKTPSKSTQIEGRVFDRASSLTEAYEQCKHLVESTHRGFIYKHRCDPDEAFSDAFIGFLYAYEHYKPEKGSFGAKVCAEVYFAMWDGLREKAKRRKHFPVDTIEVDSIRQRRHSNQRAFLMDLSDDAQIVIKVLYSLEVESERVKTYKKMLRRTLGEMGWTAARIVEAWRELGEAILA